MLSVLDNVSIAIHREEAVDCLPDGYNLICKEVHQIIASQS